MSFAPVTAWDPTNPANNANQPGIPMYEGMSPAQLNDSIRTIMTAVAQEIQNPTVAAEHDASNLSGTDVTAWQTKLGVPSVPNITSLLFQTGDVKTTLARTAPTGWLLLNGNSIGDASSGAGAYAGTGAMNLFTFLWTNLPEATVIQDSSGNVVARGATASADWAAHRRLLLPNAQGQILRVWDNGSGVDPGRTLGSLQPDQMQGFRVLSGVGANNAAGSIYGVVATDCPGGATGYSAQNAGAAANQSYGKITTDGTNGTPRVGLETRGKNIAINVMICM